MDLGEALRKNIPAECLPIIGQAGPETAYHPRTCPTKLRIDQSLKQIRRDIEAHKALLSRGIRIERPQWMPWEQDHRDLDELNRQAVTMAARIINGLILPHAETDFESPPGKSDSVDRLAWELFENVRPRGVDNTWGRIAEAQIISIAGMLGALQDG